MFVPFLGMKKACIRRHLNKIRTAHTGRFLFWRCTGCT